MYPETEKKIHQQCQQGVYPGAVYAFVEDEKTKVSAIGHRQLEPLKRPMTSDTVFDVASLTKVVCTTTALLRLWEKDLLQWDQPLQYYLPEFQDLRITLRHLLTHTSDIQTYIPNRDQLNQEQLRAAYLTLRPGKNLGKTVTYTDAGTILLGFMLERLVGKNAVTIFKEEVLSPLGMENSYFLPTNTKKIAPTQKMSDGTILKGITHDPKARVLAEHAGNAGLFTTVNDLLTFARMYLNEGDSYLNARTIRELVKDQTPTGTGKRSLGWDLRSSALDEAPLLFHTGYTGTFLVIDVFKRSAFVFLSNRVHVEDHRADYLVHRDKLLDVYLAERSKLYRK